MRCNACSYTMPYVASDDRACPSCSDGTMQITAEDWLGEPTMGLVREVRPGQISLGNIIEEAVNADDPRIIIAQGGCGIGKTFSYLIPALLSGRRIIISTAKKSLQGQLDAKDLPYLKEHLARPTSFVSVKGRNNYLCRLFLRKKRDAFTGDSGLYKRLERFLSEHPTGDLDAFPGGVRYPATLCTATECVGKGCTHATDCGYRKVKGRAKLDAAVVVNHALLGFDLKFGPQRLLGEYDILVIDEAHAAEDFFRNAFTTEISTAWMKRTLKDLHKQNIKLQDVSDKGAQRAWTNMFTQVPQQEILPAGFFGDLTDVHETLSLLLKSIDTHVMDYWPELGHINMADTERAQEAIQDVASEDRNEMLICAKMADKISEMQGALQASEDTDDNVIRVREELKEGFKVVMKPIDIGRMVGPKLASLKKVILTSATLQAELIERDLGIKATSVINEPSPFNYKANGLVYIPKTVPNPAGLQGDKTEWIWETSREIVQLVEASNGNGLVLFTSIKEMEDVLNCIEENYDVKQPIFAQEYGRRPDEVFAEFMQTDNSVLFGSKSFFEGVDVQGEKLRLVVLTKLPFPIWGDPIVQAKKQQLGNKHFAQYYLPKMFVDLMQAAGRLIRTHTDRGVFAILDVRMWVGSNKKIDPELIKISGGRWPGYGNKAFQQLPFSNVTPNFAMAKKFLEHIQK
jgi:ATP-dependent DNA helicase DinG